MSIQVKKLLLSATCAFFSAQSCFAEITVIRKEVPVQKVQASVAPESIEEKSLIDGPSLAVTEEIKLQATSQPKTVATKVSYTSASVQQFNSKFRLKNPPPYMGCFYSSSYKYAVPVDLLLAIAQTESSFQAHIKGNLGAGTDHGLMQINDYWIPRLRRQFNISLTEVYDPCTNIEVASWILAHNYLQYRNWTDAVGAYNAVTRWKQLRYVKRVKKNLEKLYAGQL